MRYGGFDLPRKRLVVAAFSSAKYRALVRVAERNATTSPAACLDLLAGTPPVSSSCAMRCTVPYFSFAPFVGQSCSDSLMPTGQERVRANRRARISPKASSRCRQHRAPPEG